jgi:uracil-DNA glycosylase
MKNDVRIDKSWKKVLNSFFETETWESLSKYVKDEYKNETIYPNPKYIFNAFDLCPFDNVKVVIIGQDPYHGKGQAHGLCFSVPEGVAVPPSLRNIYKEIKDDVGKIYKEDGNLEHWAKQGVLLLNATLTVRAGSPGSHQNKGWENFTDEVIKKINDEKENIVFMLWGNYAKEKGKYIDRKKHFVLEAAHPSPYSANNGFFGCGHFGKTNKYLKKYGKKEIQW